MKALISVAMFLTATAVFGADQSRPIMIRGWSFDIPSFLTEHVQEGPDFTVTSFYSTERKMSLGIYEGMWPQEFAKGKDGVRGKMEKIENQDVKWSFWEETKDGKKSFHAEIFLLINPASQQPEKLHIFVAAASLSDLSLLQQSVRAARRKNQP